MNSKYYKFNDKSDYIFYLSELIIDLIQNTDILKKYNEEIEFNIKNNSTAKYINSPLYNSISDKVNRRFQYIFNLIGDESKKAVSYRKFRKQLFRQRKNLKITIEELSSKEVTILGDFNKLRNWGLHIPESLYLQKKEFFKMDSQFIIENKNIIPIPTYDYFDVKFLTEMNREIQEVLDSSGIILDKMKDDYSALIGEEFTIKYEQNMVKPYLFMEAVQKSWDIQTGKLK